LSAANVLPRFYLDFNELLDSGLLPISLDNKKLDENGVLVELREGLTVSLVNVDDDLVATGTIERNHDPSSSKHVKWCVRIDPTSIGQVSDR
jgi:hypothetical protein